MYVVKACMRELRAEDGVEPYKSPLCSLTRNLLVEGSPPGVAWKPPWQAHSGATMCR